MKKIVSYLTSKSLRTDIALLAVLFGVHSSIFASYYVPSGSMKPTIHEGDLVFSNKLRYRLKLPFTKITLASWAKPQRGDIVTFENPVDGRAFVKRVIGLPGDRIRIRGGHVAINEKWVQRRLEKHHEDVWTFDEKLDGVTHKIQHHLRYAENEAFDFKVPPGAYFVMGDNRDRSSDSRSWGFVPYENITGKLACRWMSVDPGRFYLPRFDHIGGLK